MRKALKFVIGVILAAVMAFSTIAVAAAEETADTSDDGVTIIAADDGTRAYELVWKYKEHNGHLYRRRWNLTLNKWYDPAWILVQ